MHIFLFVKNIFSKDQGYSSKTRKKLINNLLQEYLLYV